MLHESPDARVDRWEDEQVFEEDLRAIMRMLRPHRDQRLQGWKEYRTGGAEFRATISWHPDFAGDGVVEELRVPRMVEVLECILVGSARSQDDLTPSQEFGIYRQVVRELYQRMDELESRYH